MNKINQFGRSMVEMLAVLALIAILSVVAIQSFNYAKSKARAYSIYKAASNLITIAKTKGRNASHTSEKIILPKNVAFINAFPLSVHTAACTNEGGQFCEKGYVIFAYGQESSDDMTGDIIQSSYGARLIAESYDAAKDISIETFVLPFPVSH